MKYLNKTIICILLSGLVAVNIFIFVHMIKIGDEINHYEKVITAIHQNNLALENKVYEVESLQYAASIAAQLNFTQKVQPVYLDNLKYALNRQL